MTRQKEKENKAKKKGKKRRYTKGESNDSPVIPDRRGKRHPWPPFGAKGRRVNKFRRSPGERNNFCKCSLKWDSL